LSAGDFLFHISIERSRRPQAAGHRAMTSHHRAQAAGRRLSISPDISPIYKAAGRRSSIREPWISSTDAPSNKNRSPVEGSFSRKKLVPLQCECEQCQAICDLDTLTLPFLILTIPERHLYKDIRLAFLHHCGFQSSRSGFSWAGFLSIASTVISLSLASSTLFISAKAWG